ncbi:MAG TPA: cation:dicarboxylase symporter family transporter [Pyrinomonadaceae bacterium]
MKRLSLTTWSIIALAAGLGLGIVGHETASPALARLGEWTRVGGSLWVAALQLTVLPLIITHLLATITAAGAKSVGKVGIHAFLLFVGMLIASGLFTIILTPILLTQLNLGPDTAATVSAAAPTSIAPTSVPTDANSGSVSVGDWISNLLPTNLIEAGMKGDLFALLLFTGFFALAVTRLPDESHLLLTNVFQGLADAMLQLVRWVLVATPFGVFALTYVLALKTGVATGGILGAYIVIVSIILILFTLLLYPLTTLAGRTRIIDVARAVAPAQLVALSTRSSIASLPALVEGGRDHLRLPSAGTSFVLPLSVSLFKVNRPISSIVKLMLVAHVYGIPLRPATLVVFLATVVIISFTAPGIPQNGPGFKTIPAYVAAGVPIEGILVVEAVEAIPDIFKTLLNVTGDMSVAALVTRSHRSRSQVIDVESSTAVESAVEVTGT